MNHYSEAIKLLGTSSGLGLKRILFQVAAQNPAAITRAAEALSSLKPTPGEEPSAANVGTPIPGYIKRCYERGGDSRLYTLQKIVRKFPVTWETAVTAVDKLVGQFDIRGWGIAPTPSPFNLTKLRREP